MLNCMREDLNKFIKVSHYDNLGLKIEKLNSGIDEASSKDHAEKDRALRYIEGFKMTKTSKDIYKYSFNNWEKVISSLDDTESFYIRTSTKVLLGTGNASVFEFGLNLLKPYGTPYISGSALKGLVSAYLAKNGGKDWWKSSKNTEKSASQVQIFGGKYGNDDYIGSVSFHNALIAPNEEHWFVSDIITTHYQEYYGGKRFPDGTENPIPIKISALDEGLRFFVVLQGPETDRKFIKKVLIEALRTDGIGGKTAVGYGRFEYLKTEEEKLEDLNDLNNNEILKAIKGRKLGKNIVFDNTIRDILEKREINIELENAYKKFCPLRFIRLQIKEDKIKTMVEFNKVVKELKNNLKAYVIEKNNPDGMFIFNYVLENFNLSTEQIIENRLLNAMSYSWDDVGINDDNIWDILENLDSRIWPKKTDLKEWIKNSNLKEKTDVLEMLDDILNAD